MRVHNLRHRGVSMCLRYAFPPNLLGYCGPQEQKALKQHIHEEKTNREMVGILSRFESLFPYLRLIARENQISDIFDYRVVDAYWIGNELVKNVHKSALKPFFTELLKLEKNTPVGLFYPNHVFHVFNVFRHRQRITHDSVYVMDNCRIGWGRIREIKGDYIFVDGTKLNNDNGLFVLKPARIVLHNPYNTDSIQEQPKIGNIVSYHWKTFCEILTDDQKVRLEQMTRLALKFINGNMYEQNNIRIWK